MCVLRCTVRLLFLFVRAHSWREGHRLLWNKELVFSVWWHRGHIKREQHILVTWFIYLYFFRVDTISERIDTGIQKAVNPVVDQLTQNIRDTLGIWHRPLSSLASGHPNPVAPPNTNPTTSSSDGMYSWKPVLFLNGFFSWLIYLPFVGFNPFDLGLSPLWQNLFDNNAQRDWWKGYLKLLFKLNNFSEI